MPNAGSARVTPEPTARAAQRMGAATFASRFIGFGRVWAVTIVLGTTYLGNTFQASNSLSNVLFELLAAGALSAVLVPTFVRFLDRGDHDGANRLANGVLALALVALGIVSVIGVLAAPWIARLLTTGAPHGRVANEQLALSTFLLRFFIPQIMLYAFGTIATAVLYAQRRFVITAIAPIANTVVMVMALVVFRVMHGPHPTLDLDLAEKLVLAAGGTLGVAGFCCIPVVALWSRGFRLRPRWQTSDPQLRRLLKLSTWAVFQHAGIGILLGAAIVMGNAVEGGVVAYQFAMVAFLAPYAILAQPVHTTLLPPLTNDANAGDNAAFARRMRWALDNLAVLTLPVSAGLVALALPGMRVITFGSSRTGVDVLAAALASLALGLYPYSVFLLLARAFYALHDSRTPAIVALVTAAIGAGVMIVGGVVMHGNARVAALGIGHTVAYLLGTIVLGVLLKRRLGHSFFPRALMPSAALAGALGAGAWLVERAIAPHDRMATATVVIGVGTAAAALYVLVARRIPRTTMDDGMRSQVEPESVVDLDAATEL